MKKLLPLLLAATLITTLFTGCAGDPGRTAAIEQLDRRMSMEWLKQNIQIGKTTKDEVLTTFGKPLTRTSTASSALGFDEMWTYSVRFSKPWSKGLDMGVDHWTRAVVFNFKDGLVSNFNASMTEF